MSRIWETPGGIHPPANKRRSLSLPIDYPELPERLMVPLDQHDGRPCRACVEVGEQVLKGELIGGVDRPLGAAVHAPSSGTVTAIKPRPSGHLSGRPARCVEIATDGHERRTSRQRVADYCQMSAPQLVDRIAQSGIAGLGGGGFPTATKLNTSGHPPIAMLIVNATECEPYVTADESPMRERADEIIQGIDILAHIHGNRARVVIVIEQSKPEASAAPRTVYTKSALEIVEIPRKYPSGGERQLIYALTEKQLPNGNIPANIGVLCINVATVYAIKRAVIDGEPLISRVVTVTGGACATQRNYQALIGTPIKHLLRHSGVNSNRLNQLIMGGSNSGFKLPSDEVPMVKISYCILAPDIDEFGPAPPERACIRCGRCADVYPASLLRQQLLWHAKASNQQQLEEHNLFDCIECGACEYVCPSHIALVDYYRAGKVHLDAARQVKSNAAQARRRFEFHQLRLARLEREQSLRSAAVPSNAARAPVARLSSADIIAAAQNLAASRQPTIEQTRDKLQRNIGMLQNRLELAERRLVAAGDVTLNKQNSLRAAVEGARQKLQRAEQRLTEQAHG
jgi:electron transport complex protein RnfC